jgi:hypothetical protein
VARCSPRRVSYLEAASPENRIDLELKLTGWLRARDDNEDSHRFTSDPLPGESIFQSFGQANQALLRFEVARSDWFSNVLEPIGTVDYVSTEIVLPRGDDSLKAAINQLRRAESAYATHDNPPSFSIAAERSTHCQVPSKRSSHPSAITTRRDCLMI